MYYCAILNTYYFWKCKKMKKINIKTVAVLALLIAVEIVLSRLLSISLQNVKLGLSFLVVAFAAREYGILGGTLVGGLSDLVGALILPIGPYFPGFTLTAALCGAVYGIFLKNASVKKIALAQIINNFILGMLLNSFWISLLYGAPYLSLLPIRAIQAAILTAVGIPALHFMNKYVPRIAKR